MKRSWRKRLTIGICLMMGITALAGVQEITVVTIKEWEKKTNTKIEFQHPTMGAETEQFNVMIASSQLPDAMFVNGDYAKLFNDGIIIRFNELIDEYAPNLKKILEENPEVAKQLKADSGDIYAIRICVWGNTRPSAARSSVRIGLMS